MEIFLRKCSLLEANKRFIVPSSCTWSSRLQQTYYRSVESRVEFHGTLNSGKRLNDVRGSRSPVVHQKCSSVSSKWYASTRLSTILPPPPPPSVYFPSCDARLRDKSRRGIFFARFVYKRDSPLFGSLASQFPSATNDIGGWIDL